MKEKILISGAGIAGLTLKNLLERLNYDVYLCEKEDTLRTQGAGLLLGANVLKIFRQMGLEEQILQKAQVIDAFITTDAKGKELDTVDFKQIYAKTSYRSVGIHRQELHQILFANMQHTNLLFDHELTNFAQDDKSYIVAFKNGKQKRFDHLISSEGIFSQCREKIYGKTELRTTSQVCWRFVIDAPQNFERSSGYEMWGDQKRVGILPLGTDKLYCYLVATQKGGEEKLSYQEVLQLFESFEGRYGQLKETLLHISPKILYNVLADTQEITLQSEGIVFVGDSGHATTPNLGQGAAMAIESAYTFYTLLQKHKFSLAAQFYEQTRLKKVQKIKERSMLVGKFSHLRSKLLQKIRNIFMQFIPSAITQKEFEKLILDGEIK